jgi:hypothetical protein
MNGTNQLKEQALKVNRTHKLQSVFDSHYVTILPFILRLHKVLCRLAVLF